MFAAYALMILTLAACQTTEQQRYADHQTCYGMGTTAGTSGHTACMLQQQQRRDEANLRRLEETRLSYEISNQVQDILDRQ